MCRTLLIVVPLLASVAHADVDLTLGSRFGAGYSTNIYLDAAVLPAEGDEHPSPLLTVGPTLQLGLGTAHRFTVSWDGELRQLVDRGTEHESLLEHRLVLAYTTPPFAGFSFSVGGAVEQLYVRVADGMGWIGGWGSLRVSRPLGYAVRASLTYLADHDRYAGGAAASWELAHRLLAAVTVRVARGLTLEPAYTFSVAQADPSELGSIQHAGGLDLRWEVPRIPLELQLGYTFTALWLPDLTTTVVGKGREVVGRQDLIHAVRGQALVRLTTWLGLYARYDGSMGWSNQEPERYARHQVTGGLALQWSMQRGARPPRGAPLELQLRAPDARRVAVVGSFNDWEPTPNVLRRDGDGIWRGQLDLPPGRHQIMLWVDGTLRLPDPCPAAVLDGFGGQTCVITVER